ncbi:MAG: hypothetical protein DHS80DRAFT_24340 [Piptocephalis tieghemiana]|nr:MAG: hypothetical protein DHS80DRAFT_24340 [Piptocephalis tieghemiana]
MSRDATWELKAPTRGSEPSDTLEILTETLVHSSSDVSVIQGPSGESAKEGPEKNSSITDETDNTITQYRPTEGFHPWRSSGLGWYFVEFYGMINDGRTHLTTGHKVEAVARYGRRRLEDISVHVPGKSPWQCGAYISFLDRASQVAKSSKSNLLESFKRDYPLRRAPMARVTDPEKVKEDERWTGIIARMEDQVMANLNHTSRPATMEEERALNLFHLRHMTELSSLVWMNHDSSFGIQRDTVLLMHEALREWLKKLVRKVLIFHEEARRVGDERIKYTETIDERSVRSAIEGANVPMTRESWFKQLEMQLFQEGRLGEEEEEEEEIEEEEGEEEEEMEEENGRKNLEDEKDGIVKHEKDVKEDFRPTAIKASNEDEIPVKDDGYRDDSTTTTTTTTSSVDGKSARKRMYLPEHVLRDITHIDPFALESIRGRNGYGSTRNPGGKREEREYARVMEEERRIEERQQVLDQLNVAGILDYM